MSYKESKHGKLRYSLKDIDNRLQYVSELAEALGVDPSQIIIHILTSLKLKLNSEIKKTSPAKRQCLLEYLFPYAILDDYSPLVSYLLEHEDDIPEIVMEKLLHDSTYSSFLTPLIKVNIYKKRRDYFDEDVNKVIKELSTHVDPQASVLERCPNSDKMLFNSLFLENIHVLSNDSLLQMTGDDSSLKSSLCESLLNYIINPENHLDIESQSQLYKLVFSLLKENQSIILELAHSEIDENQSKHILINVKKLFNTLSTILDSDRTISRESRRYYETDIYDPTTKLLQNLFKEKSIQIDYSNITAYNSRRLVLFQSSIDKMISLDFRHIFTSPVTDEIARDYKDIIKHPMDLGTMKNKVSQYTSFQEIRDDLQLIVTNSEIYNGKSAPYTQIAYDLRRQWIEILGRAEEQDKQLRKTYNITASSTLSIATAEETCKVAENTLSYLLLIVALTFATPAYQNQLLRAIFQRVNYLCLKQTSPSDKGIADPILYTYWQYYSLSHHISDLLSVIQGKSSFFPSAFFATDYSVKSIEQYIQYSLYLFQIILFSQIDQGIEGIDLEVISSLNNQTFRYLLYTACSSQVSKIADLIDTSRLKGECLLLSNICQLIKKISADDLKKEWQWIEVILFAQVIKRNQVSIQALTILLENILFPCLVNSTLFSIAFKSFFLFLRCIKACSSLSERVISQISSCLNKMNIPKHSIEDLDEITKKQVKESSGTVSDFRVILLQLFSDYSTLSEIPNLNDSSITEQLSPSRNGKRSSPSQPEPESMPTQEDSEDDFF